VNQNASFVLGYNTNGLCHHDPCDALELLAEIGYGSVAITLDHHCLAPGHNHLKSEIKRIRETLTRCGLRNVIETGARFLLDRYIKHEPTLMTADAQARQRRIEFYCRAIEIAAELESECVSLWSGVLREDCAEPAAFQRLVEGLEPVLDYAAKFNVVIGFEPEPGMFIDTMQRYDRLLDLLDAPHFQLTLDIGHLHCLGETPLDAYIRRYGSRLVNVHLEDMRRGVHEHLPFGEGEMDLAPVFQALSDVAYQGGVHVELSRHSHEGPTQAAESYHFLRRFTLQ
jgi:sugar phosphate isomerase/epimerase